MYKYIVYYILFFHFVPAKKRHLFTKDVAFYLIFHLL